MTINVEQVINAIVANFTIFLIIVGLLFFIFAAFDIEFRPPKVRPVDKLTLGRVVIMVAAVLLVIFGLINLPWVGRQVSPGTPTNSPTATITGKITPTPTIAGSITPADQFASSLIPSGQNPVITDPLKDNSQGYAWDEETSASGSCQFVQGYYRLSAPAGDSNGIGCNPENAKGLFHNFVYQIGMKILAGVDAGQAGVGPTFRVNPTGNGQQYQVTFTVSGDWSVETDVQPLTSIGPSCANPCPFFTSGVNNFNVITISASGPNIQIQINGHPLGTYRDTTYTSGYIGVQLSPGTEDSSVAFSNLRVWVL